MDIKLNKEQLEAIHHSGGPLLIIAGAGTGKTTVVTERVKWLIEKDLAKPQEILALTFTEKAAREMEERVDIALPYGVTQMYITTFHSFGEGILRDEAVSIGLDSGFRLMTSAESVIFFRQNLFVFDLDYFRPLGNPKKFIEAILAHFDRLKDEDITPKQYLDWIKHQISKSKLQSEEKKIENKKYLELAKAYRQYEELKVKEGVMDFADLISNTLLLLRKRKDILRHYQNRFKYVLIDEFQDTNIAQNELAILLAGKEKNVTVVADDDQAIYRWRGAAVSNIIQFRKRFRGVKIVVLKQNYRSTETILDASYKLIQNNNPDRLEVKENINKKLIPVRKISGAPIDFIFTSRVEDEAEVVAAKITEIRKQMKEDGESLYHFRDFAILVRANSHADPFVRTFQRKGIPYQFLGPGMLLRQPEVKDLIAYLKFLTMQDESVALFRVLNLDIFALPVRDLNALLNFSKRLGLSLFEALDVYIANKQKRQDHWSKNSNYTSYLPFLNPNTDEILLKIFRMIENHLMMVKNDSAGQILYSFLEETGLLKKFTSYKSVKQEREILNISKFFDKIKSYEVTHEDASVQAVSDWIDMSLELGESPLATDTDWVKNDAVNILTVHSAKGLEFKIVFLVNLVTDRFPTRERREKIPIPDELIKEILPLGDYHLEEERRLFYVGQTRARDYLVLSASAYYGEAKRARKISPFVVETLGEKVLSITNKPKEEGRQLTLLEWKKEKIEEIKVKKQDVNYLSYSQVNTFLTCPLQYKYRYVLKIPVPPSAAASFGTSVHKALQQFYQLHKSGEGPTKETLLGLLDTVWIPLGYGNKKYEEKMKTRGKNMLSLYYDKGYKKDSNVVDLEKLFRIKLSSNLRLGGKMDRIDRFSDGKLEIIDYKTGRRPSDKEIAADLQLTVYALAAEDRGLYGKSPEEVILSFYYLAEGEKISLGRNKEELDKAQKKLLGIVKDIESSDFAPKVGRWCDFCDFRLICEAWQ